MAKSSGIRPVSALNRRESVCSSVRLPKPEGSEPERPIAGRRNIITLPLAQTTPVHEQGLVWVEFHNNVRPPTALRSNNNPALSEARSEQAMLKRLNINTNRIASLTRADFILVVRVVRGNGLLVRELAPWGNKHETKQPRSECAVLIKGESGGCHVL